MKRLLHILACVSAVIALYGCENKNTPLDSFILDETIRLELDGVKVFVYDNNRCQLAFNEQRRLFRANSDTMLNYFELVLDRIPDKEGEDLTGNLWWSTVAGERSRNNITLNVKRIKGDIIWLCDTSQRTAVVIRVLE
ncbi:MAG: hypothetical protein J6O51_03000 [Bacteroidales bacterium]|nr:hypothetical protein [Bacteroidales bacterium]